MFVYGHHGSNFSAFSNSGTNLFGVYQALPGIF